jgi:hypothetical protein
MVHTWVIKLINHSEFCKRLTLISQNFHLNVPIAQPYHAKKNININISFKILVSTGNKRKIAYPQAKFVQKKCKKIIIHP